MEPNKFFLFSPALFLLSIIVITISTNSWLFYKNDHNNGAYYRTASGAGMLTLLALNHLTLQYQKVQQIHKLTLPNWAQNNGICQDK